MIKARIAIKSGRNFFIYNDTIYYLRLKFEYKINYDLTIQYLQLITVEYRSPTFINRK